MQLSQLITTSEDISTNQKDEELVLAAQKNLAAFQTIYDRWAVRIYQYFYFRTREPASAEDLTSQLFLSVLQALPRYQHRGTFAAWLFAIARNVYKEYARKRYREIPLEAAVGLTESTNMPDEVTHLDEVAHLRRLVQSLSEDEQELLRLRYIAELPFADMAMILGKREDAVKKSLYRLQARLQSALKGGSLSEENHDDQ